MIRPRKVLAVARFELLSVVRTKGYLIATFGMPVFLALYGLLVTIPARYAERSSKSDHRRHGVVDQSGVLGIGEERQPIEVAAVDAPAAARAAVELAGNRVPIVREAVAPLVFLPYADEGAARAAFDAGEVASYYQLEPDYAQTGRVRHVRREGVELKAELVHAAFARLLRQRLLAGRVPAELVQRIERPVAKRESWTIDAAGKLERFDLLGTVLRFAVPGLLSMLLFIALMTGTGYLVQGLGTEKQNRVVEVLLSSIEPDELLFGKLLGLGGAGLLQVAVWFSMLLVIGIVATTALALTGVAIPWLLLLVGVPYVILTYLLFGSLMLATGALGGSGKESQQYSVVWVLLAVSPMIGMSVLLAQPNGVLARVFTYVPFTSGVTLLIRLTIAPDGVPWIDLVLPLVLLLGAIWTAIRLGARLFRVGLLLTGSRPRWRELLRQARLGP